jgi:hypothetical protein
VQPVNHPEKCPADILICATPYELGHRKQTRLLTNENAASQQGRCYKHPQLPAEGRIHHILFQSKRWFFSDILHTSALHVFRIHRNQEGITGQAYPITIDKAGISDFYQTSSAFNITQFIKAGKPV